MVAGLVFERKIGLNEVTVHPLHSSSLPPITHRVAGRLCRPRGLVLALKRSQARQRAYPCVFLCLVFLLLFGDLRAGALDFGT